MNSSAVVRSKSTPPPVFRGSCAAFSSPAGKQPAPPDTWTSAASAWSRRVLLPSNDNSGPLKEKKWRLDPTERWQSKEEGATGYLQGVLNRAAVRLSRLFAYLTSGSNSHLRPTLPAAHKYANPKRRAQSSRLIRF